MIRFGYLMELSAGPLMLCIKFSTNACSTPQPRDLHNSKPQRCSPHLVADPSPLFLSGPAHRLVLGAIHDGYPIQDTSAHKPASEEPLAACLSVRTRTTTTCCPPGNLVPSLKLLVVVCKHSQCVRCNAVELLFSFLPDSIHAISCDDMYSSRVLTRC